MGKIKKYYDQECAVIYQVWNNYFRSAFVVENNLRLDRIRTKSIEPEQRKEARIIISVVCFFPLFLFFSTNVYDVLLPFSSINHCINFCPDFYHTKVSAQTSVQLIKHISIDRRSVPLYMNRMIVAFFSLWFCDIFESIKYFKIFFYIYLQNCINHMFHYYTRTVFKNNAR